MNVVTSANARTVQKRLFGLPIMCIKTIDSIFYRCYYRYQSGNSTKDDQSPLLAAAPMRDRYWLIKAHSISCRV